MKKKLISRFNHSDFLTNAKIHGDAHRIVYFYGKKSRPCQMFYCAHGPADKMEYYGLKAHS